MKNLVVGVDGTVASRVALKWAAGVVGRTGRIHAVVAVNPWTERVVDAISGRERPFGDELERDLVENWSADVGFAVAELKTSVISKSTAVALDDVAIADEADAIVVGQHEGISGVVRRIGHTTSRLIRITHHPVVVVPIDCAVDLDGGHVVVGVGHGHATRSAVRWAAHLVPDHGVSIELLQATRDAPVFQAEGPLDFAKHELGGPAPEASELEHADHFAALMHTLVGPGLDLTISTPAQLAAVGLEEASERSSLLVVGRHRSMFDGGRHTAQPLRHALTHARCPVAVVADRPADEMVS